MKKKYNGFYLMANYPDAATFKKGVLKGLEFFDFIEIGIPFSDPIADGAVITNAGQSVLDKGFIMKDFFRDLKELSKEIPSGKDIYLMTYSNHVYQNGVDKFCKISADAGVKGFILPDVPYIEKDQFEPIAREFNLDIIHFLTPESDDEAISSITSDSHGFVYFITVRGITGSEFKLDDITKEKIKQASQKSAVPVVLGFGIRTIDHADEALKLADGFIMGSKPVELIGKNSITEFSNFIDELKILNN